MVKIYNINFSDPFRGKPYYFGTTKLGCGKKGKRYTDRPHYSTHTDRFCIEDIILKDSAGDRKSPTATRLIVTSAGPAAKIFLVDTAK